MTVSVRSAEEAPTVAIINDGDYLSVDKLNKLDGQTGNLNEETGWWQNQVGAGGGIDLDVTRTPVFGTFHGKVTVSVTSASQGAAIRAERDTVPAAEGEAWSAFANVSSAQTGDFARLRIRFYNVGLSTLTTTKGTYVATSDTGFTTHKIENVVAPADTAWVSLWIEFSSSDVGDGARTLDDVYYWDAVTLAKATTIDQFTPSLTATTAADTVVAPFGLTEDDLATEVRVGDNYTGGARLYRQLDEVGGPVVAEMDPQDAIDAHGLGALADQATWTDSYGNIWTANGTGLSLHVIAIDKLYQFPGVDLFGEPDHEQFPVELPTVMVVTPIDTQAQTVSLPQVTWTFTHPNGDPQQEYQIRILDPDSVVVLDTGWLQGSASMFDWSTADRDLFAAFDYADGDIYTVEVTAHGGPHRGYSAFDSVTFIANFGQPSAVFTAPDPEVRDWQIEKITVAWDYSDTRAVAQEAFRVRLLLGDVERFDSFWTYGTVTTYQPDYLLQDGVLYTAALRVRNTNGIELSVP